MGFANRIFINYRIFGEEDTPLLMGNIIFASGRCFICFFFWVLQIFMVKNIVNLMRLDLIKIPPDCCQRRTHGRTPFFLGVISFMSQQLENSHENLNLVDQLQQLDLLFILFSNKCINFFHRFFSVIYFRLFYE